MKDSIGSSVQASLRDAQPFPAIILSRPLSLGLKPTATIMQSLRDCSKTEMRLACPAVRRRIRRHAGPGIRREELSEARSLAPKKSCRDTSRKVLPVHAPDAASTTLLPRTLKRFAKP